MTLGQNIRHYRQEARLSQEKLAELMDISRQAVTKWEGDLSAPSTENLIRLAEILGTTVETLIGREAPESEPTAEEILRQYRQEQVSIGLQKRISRRRNIQVFLLILLGYLAAFLTGRFLSGTNTNTAVVSWLFTTDPKASTYLFGWLLSSRFFLYASLVSALPALLGKRLYALTSLLGFWLALPSGELCGQNPQNAGEHWGWLIWLLIFLLFSLLGGIGQKLFGNKPDLKSRRLYILLGIGLLGSAILIIAIRLGMRPAAY